MNGVPPLHAVEFSQTHGRTTTILNTEILSPPVPYPRQKFGDIKVEVLNERNLNKGRLMVTSVPDLDKDGMPDFLTFVDREHRVLEEIFELAISIKTTRKIVAWDDKLLLPAVNPLSLGSTLKRVDEVHAELTVRESDGWMEMEDCVWDPDLWLGVDVSREVVTSHPAQGITSPGCYTECKQIGPSVWIKKTTCLKEWSGLVRTTYSRQDFSFPGLLYRLNVLTEETGGLPEFSPGAGSYANCFGISWSGGQRRTEWHAKFCMRPPFRTTTWFKMVTDFVPPDSTGSITPVEVDAAGDVNPSEPTLKIEPIRVRYNGVMISYDLGELLTDAYSQNLQTHGSDGYYGANTFDYVRWHASKPSLLQYLTWAQLGDYHLVETVMKPTKYGIYQRVRTYVKLI